MADTLQFDLVSPERKLASVQATEIRIPGTDGDLTVMAGHTPTITTLRPGLLQVVHQGGTDDYVVSGGFAEIGPDQVSVLAERALPRGEVTQEVYEGLIEEFAAAHRDARAKFENEPGPVDDTAKLLADMVAVGTHIGLDPKQPNF